MDPKRIPHALIIVNDDVGPPPPHLIPYIVRAVESQRDYHTALRITLIVLLQALLLAVLQLEMRYILLFMLSNLLLLTAVRGLTQWDHRRDLEKAIEQGPPKET
jgi:hypothetical protein